MPMGTMDGEKKKKNRENLLLDQELQEGFSLLFQKTKEEFRHYTRK